MATMYGFTLKKIVEYKGHEGEPLVQADIYYLGKKIGFWRMGDYGGEDDFLGVDSHFLPKEYFDTIRMNWKNPLQDEEDFKNYVFSDESVASSFFAHLMELIDMEKEFKKVVKKGFQALIQVSISFYTATFHIPTGHDLEKAKDVVVKQFDRTYPKWTEHPKTVKVYSDLSQFVVG